MRTLIALTIAGMLVLGLLGWPSSFFLVGTYSPSSWHSFGITFVVTFWRLCSLF